MGLLDPTLPESEVLASLSPLAFFLPVRLCLRTLLIVLSLHSARADKRNGAPCDLGADGTLITFSASAAHNMDAMVTKLTTMSAKNTIDHVLPGAHCIGAHLDEYTLQTLQTDPDVESMEPNCIVSIPPEESESTAGTSAGECRRMPTPPPRAFNLHCADPPLRWQSRRSGASTASTSGRLCSTASTTTADAMAAGPSSTSLTRACVPPTPSLTAERAAAFLPDALGLSAGSAGCSMATSPTRTLLKAAPAPTARTSAAARRRRTSASPAVPRS